MSKSVVLKSVLKDFIKTFNVQSYVNQISIGQNIVTRKEIVWIRGPFSKNFWNKSTIAGWSFTKGTDPFQGAPGCRWH